MSRTPHSPPLSAAVQQYLTTRVRRGEFAPSTVYSVRSALQRFAAHLGPDRAVGGLTARQARGWWDSLTCTPSTARANLVTVRTFLRWCVDQGWLRRNPLDGVRAPREPRRVPTTLDRGEVATLLARLPDRRAIAMATLMVQCGLRCGEVARLQMEDVDRRTRTMLVHGKGGHQRLLPITAEAWGALQAYLDEHPAPGHGPVFRSYLATARPLTAGYVSNLLGDWMRAAGVKRRPHDGVSAHALRRTMASDLLDGGANVRQVQAALGHAHLNTTEVYLRRVVGEDLRDVMEGRRYVGATGDPPALRLVA